MSHVSHSTSLSQQSGHTVDNLPYLRTVQQKEKTLIIKITEEGVQGTSRSQEEQMIARSDIIDDDQGTARAAVVDKFFNDFSMQKFEQATDEDGNPLAARNLADEELHSLTDTVKDYPQ
jgi:hypothetical protein